jgi:hypothetical protein
LVLAPTPPPDIDIEQWHQSVARIGEWQADTLFLTHFGPWSPAAPHLTEFVDQLELASGLVRTSLARDEPDAAREAWFAEEVRRELRRRIGDADERAYEVAGLARYWRKRA